MKISLPKHFHDGRVYWAHMLTFRCNGGCPFCILDGRGRHSDFSEISGTEILSFWNNIEHKNGQRLSLIGGETTFHPDFLQIVNGLKNYYITVTTNCSGPFYKDPEFYKKIQPDKSSKLRINTSFHPHHIDPKEYIRVIKLLRKTGYFVDQTSYVYRPDINKYQKEIDEVNKEIHIDAPPYLGFYTEEDQFNAPAHPKNLQPNENFHDSKAVKERCGLTDLTAYKDMCGHFEQREVNCEHPFLSLIIGPNGNFYNCHYKLYYDIDPVCNIKNFIPVVEKHKICRHYGFCNWCDVPRVTCSINTTRKRLVINKLCDKSELVRSEVSYLLNDITDFAEKNDLIYDSNSWFEYAYTMLYSGKRHRCNVLYIGSPNVAFPYYLIEKGYNVTMMNKRNTDFHKINLKYIENFDLILNFKTIQQKRVDETLASINISKYLRQGGYMIVSTHFGKQPITRQAFYNKTVQDQSDSGFESSIVFSGSTFLNKVVKPLEMNGFTRIGDTNYNNVNLDDVSNLIKDKDYTTGIVCLRRD